MKHHTILGGGGTKIHAVEAGDPNGRPLVFIHGFSQCWLAWTRQLSSDLADDYRLVAIDMRGHGLSDKPRDGYGDSKAWADDLAAVISTLGLKRPVLSGWSYGPLVILDYIRHYGQDGVGGIHIVAGTTNLGSEEAASYLAPDFLNLIPGFFSTEVEQSVQSLDALLRLCCATALQPETRYLILGYNLCVPPHVRQALFSRTLDNDDLLAQLSVPVLVSHGEEDRILRPAIADRHASRVRHAEVHMMPRAGHACFWDNAHAFNRHLGLFAQKI